MVNVNELFIVRMYGFNQGINLVKDLVNRTRVEPVAAAAATAASGVAEKMDTITTSDNHDVANQEIEQDRTVDQTTLYQYAEC